MVFLSRYTQAGAALVIGVATSFVFSWSDQWFVSPAQARDALVHQARQDALARYVASAQQASSVERCFQAGQMVRTLVRTGGVAELAHWRQIHQQDCRPVTSVSLR